MPALSLPACMPTPPPPAVPPRLRLAPGASVVLSACLALAGCGERDPNAFPPPCPQVGIPADAGDLARYRPTGHDITDLELSARVEGVQGTCKPAEHDRLAAHLAVGFRIARGPAAGGRSFDVPYFVAVTRGEAILDKQVYTLHVEFPANVETVDLQGAPVDLLLPTPPGTLGTAYRVLAGFQLTEAELQQNRRRLGP